MKVLAFFGQKKVRIYPLRRTHDYDLVDRPGAAPGAPANSATLTQLFPHMARAKVVAIIRNCIVLPSKKLRNVKVDQGNLAGET
jgi:hypothetical protein